MARDVCPSADLNESLGAANQRWKKVYVGEVVEEESNFISRLVTKLASKAAISVSSLSKESIFYRLLSYAFDASGVEYNFNNANAWYICFGDLLGGLIIQGGAVYDVSRGYNLTFPVSFLSTERVVGNDMSSVSEAGMQVISFGNVSNTGATICAMRINQTDSNVWCHWLAIGR